MAEGPAKLRYRWLEPTIQKFVKVAIPTDLERLHKHQINIEKLHTELLAFIHTCIFWDSCVNAEVLTMLSKLCHQLPGCAPMLDSLCILPMHPVDIIFIGIYQRWGQWDKLHQEHINASRTVQQLQANMREMETICLRVRDEDSQALEKIINPVKERAAAAVEEFLKLHSQLSEVHSDHGNVENSQDPHSSLVRSQTIAGTFTGSQDSGSPLHQHSVQLNVPLPQIPQDHDAAESWENLEENLIDLSNLVTEFSQLLHIQQEKIDSIEDHVSTAAENVEEGTKNLAKAAKYKLAMLPVAGALIGGAIGGPIGLLAGFKVAGAAAAVGGGILGFTGGRMLLKNQQQKIDQELALSSSCPELKTQAGKKS